MSVKPQKSAPLKIPGWIRKGFGIGILVTVWMSHVQGKEIETYGKPKEEYIYIYFEFTSHANARIMEIKLLADYI